jgi:hypothetical protein
MPLDAPQVVVEEPPERIRADWVAELERIAADVARWAAAEDWAVRRQTKTLRDARLGQYEVPVMSVQTAFGRVHFNPIARFLMGVDGEIDVYAEPSFAQRILFKTGGEWRLFTDDQVDLGRTWSEQTFGDLVRDLPVAP